MLLKPQRSVPGGPDDAGDELGASPLLEHAKTPYHRGRAGSATHAGTLRNPACGDWVRLELVTDRSGRIAEAWFEGGGCLVSQSAASVLCEFIEGRSLRDLRSMTAAQMLRLLGASLTPGRLRCGLLALEVLKSILDALDRSR